MMDSSHEGPTLQTTTASGQRKRPWLLLLIGLAGVLLMLIVVLNFVPVYLVTSQTEAQASLETGRSGETLPANMAPGFTLHYQVLGAANLETVVSTALPDALAETNVGQATAVENLNAGEAPRLLVALDVAERVWTPIYGRARVTATLHFANTADVPWPQDAPMMLTESPEIQARGDVTVQDTTWGLLAKPAYNRLLGDALAEAIAAGLQRDVFQRP